MVQKITRLVFVALAAVLVSMPSVAQVQQRSQVARLKTQTANGPVVMRKGCMPGDEALLATGCAFGMSRTPFVSYTNRDMSLIYDRRKSDAFQELKWTQTAGGRYMSDLTLSLLQMDRDVFLRFEDIRAPFVLYVNDSLAGVCMQRRGQAELWLDPFTREGYNRLEIVAFTPPDLVAQTMGPAEASFELPGCTYVNWQPMVHLEDFTVRASLDSVSPEKGVLEVEMAVYNSFNGESGPMQIWFELEDDKGTLVDYSYAETDIPAYGRDTSRFVRRIRTVEPWSAERPYLYRLVMKIRQKGSFTEYTATRIGFRSISFDSTALMRVNGAKLKQLRGVELPTSAIQWNAKQMADSLAAYKKMDVNVLSISMPMDYAFYDLTDRLGFYVNQSADLNTMQSRVNDLTLGDPNNTVSLIPYYDQQVQKLYRVHKNRTSIVSWELGRGLSNGYTTQRAYMTLKGLDAARPVWYAPAKGQWNSDLDSMECVSSSEAKARWGVVRPTAVKKKKGRK